MTQILPIATIQPTFAEVISDVRAGLIPQDTFWVSCYRADAPSVHAKVDVTLHGTDRDRVLFAVREGDVDFAESDNGAYIVACASLGIPPTTVVLPTTEYTDPERANPQQPHKITAFAASPDGTQFATGFLDGTVRIYPAGAAKPHLTARPHLSTVSFLSFFPSSRVVLTAGADFTITVLPAEPPSAAPARTAPARTLRGHTRTITATAIVARGRNVVSAALDGSVRLWDVSSGAQIRVWLARTGVEAICLAEIPGGLGSGQEAAVDDREVDTAGKVVFAALSDGSVEAFDLRRQSAAVLRLPPQPASLSLAAIAYSPVRGGVLATGAGAGGGVCIWDVSKIQSGDAATPLASWRRNTAGIASLAFVGESLVVAGADGLPYVVRLNGEEDVATKVETVAELVGGDCYPVRVVQARDGEGEVWTAGDDGVVRVYKV
ncbi:hypothetical protein PLICRDRAFT_91516 [Plicaturopsis crispa FD-325 SS-3]|nr:hypothetical protein PLICRDRAFT_91516 [Plicaturopsis crispa FD-325 SS-3]